MALPLFQGVPETEQVGEFARRHRSHCWSDCWSDHRLLLVIRALASG